MGTSNHIPHSTSQKHAKTQVLLAGTTQKGAWGGVLWESGLQAGPLQLAAHQGLVQEFFHVAA